MIPHKENVISHLLKNEITMKELIYEVRRETPKDKNRGTLDILKGTSKFLTLKIPSEIKGSQIITLIDGGVTHNFIDKGWVERKGSNQKYYENFG